MATGPQFCGQHDVELAVGGTPQLAQLLDKDGDGIADADLVASIIARASGEVAAAVSNVSDIATFTAPYPDALVYAAANIAAFYAWTMGSGETAVPDGAKALHEDALRFLDQLARRERSLGVASPPASKMEAKQVDQDPGGLLGRVTRNALKGWW